MSELLMGPGGDQQGHAALISAPAGLAAPGQWAALGSRSATAQWLNGCDGPAPSLVFKFLQ